ncbi:substrate-binding and VWA domain-containing protein [Actinomadura rugatobispora]|uniref:Substrate-binding and VWA domain-containing protein n=1 Tax=Actinomadura rugatobispora TaxID=1994 RepID=A0ABW0ZXU4_9ACTN
MKRRARRRPPLSVVIAVLAVLVASMVGVGLSRLGGSCGEGEKETLRLAADPAIAPAVTATAQRFDDRCLEIVVTAAPSAASVLTLGGARRESRADAFILDSSLWLAMAGSAAQRTGAAVPRPVGSAALSPLVLVRSQATPPPPGGLTWRSLRRDAHSTAYGLRIVDPESDASGVAALLMARRGGGDTSLAGFTDILREAQSHDSNTVAKDAGAALANLARSSDRSVLAVSEQSVRRHARTGGAPVVAQTPGDGTVTLDFPLIVHGSARADDAKRFLAELNSRRGARELAKIGLRPANDRAGGATIDPRATLETLEMWRRMRLGTRMLTLVDVSGSMDQQVPGTGETRMTITAGELTKGIALLPDEAEAGVWAFSTGMDGTRPYRSLAPVGRLGGVSSAGTHRAAVQQALGRLRAKPDGDTGLYDSILAAFRTMKAGYRADMINIVLVLSDGRNDFAGGITETALLGELRKEYDPARPVQVIGLAFGPDIDIAALKRVSEATGGTAYRLRDPREILELFGRSAALKICDNPGRCPTG